MGRKRWSERGFRTEAHDHRSCHWRKRQSKSEQSLGRCGGTTNRLFPKERQFSPVLVSYEENGLGNCKGLAGNWRDGLKSSSASWAILTVINDIATLSGRCHGLPTTKRRLDDEGSVIYSDIDCDSLL